MSDCKFKIGDKVRRINCDNSAPGWTFRVGETGVVTRIDSIGYVDVEVNGVNCFGNDPMYLELVESECPTFKIGDRVIVEESNIDYLLGSHKGKVGTVVGIMPIADHPYQVRIDGVATLWCKVDAYADEK